MLYCPWILVPSLRDIATRMFPSWAALKVLVLFSATKFPSFCSQLDPTGGHQARSWHLTSIKATVHGTLCQGAGEEVWRDGLPLLALQVGQILVPWESWDKETWTKNTWKVSGIAAISSAWPKLAWFFSIWRTARDWDSLKGPWRAQDIIKWVWTWRKFHNSKLTVEAKKISVFHE